MILGLVVFLSMAPMDVCSTMKIEFLDRDRPWLAGLCELVSDWGGALSYGVGGAGLLRYRFSLTTLFIFGCLGTASILGTKAGHRLTNRSVQ